MKLDIILAGVGGQGILSIATVIGYAAVESGLSLKQAEVHGMSQRGGDVQSHLRISDKTIYSDLVPEGAADIILSVEPMESLRYIPYLSPEGWLVTNTTPYKNIANYPDLDAVLKEVDKVPQHVAIDADGTASYSDPTIIERKPTGDLRLLAPAPNPVRTQTQVRFSLPEDTGSEVQLKLYDVMGRELRTIQVPAEKGRHKRRLDVQNLTSGIYFLRLAAEGQFKTRKVTVVR